MRSGLRDLTGPLPQQGLNAEHSIGNLSTGSPFSEKAAR